MQAAPAVVLLMVAGGIAFVVGGALGIGGGGLASGRPQGHPLETGSTPASDVGAPAPTASGRTGALCVDALSVSSPVSDEPAIEESVRASAATVASENLSNPGWQPLGWKDVSVTAGCPGPPLPLTMEGTWTFGTPGDKAPPSVDALSPYSLFIFVMPLEDIDMLLGGTDVRAAGQEYQCSMDVCFPRRTAVYVTPEEAVNPELLRVRIEEGLGLRDPY
jgi:hypothetical protein